LRRITRQLPATLAVLACSYIAPAQAAALEDFSAQLDLPGIGSITDVAAYPPGPMEGKVLVLAGQIYRFQADGTLDPTFGHRGVVQVGISDKTLAIDAAGRALVGGFTLTPSSSLAIIARLKPSGRLDRSFADEGLWRGHYDGGVEDIDIDTSGPVTRILAMVGDDFDGSAWVYRFEEDGSLDSNFDGNGRTRYPQPGNDDGWAHRSCCIAAQDDGKVVLGIEGSEGSPLKRFEVARLDETGDLDGDFGNGGSSVFSVGNPAHDSVPYDLALHESGPGAGKVVIVGQTGPPTDERQMAIAQLTSDGELDGGFGNEGALAIDVRPRADFARAVGIDQDGRVLVAGTGGSGVPEQYLGLLLRFSDGGLDPSFGNGGVSSMPNGPDLPIALDFDPYGPVVAGGKTIRWFGARVDTIPPETWIDAGPRNGAVIRRRRARFEFSSNDPRAYLHCRVDGIRDPYCDSPVVLRRLAHGSHRFSVRAVGDPTPAKRRFEVRAR